MSDRTYCLAGYSFVIVFFLLIWLLRTSAPPFSPDSWSFYEISQSVFNDFGKINTLRHYQQDLVWDRNVSFPPLWPILIRVFDGFSRMGIYSGYILNAIFLLLSLYMNARIGQDLIGYPLAGVFLSVLMLSYKNFVGEFLSAGSMPLAFLFQQMIVYIVLTRDKIAPKDAILLAMISGLCVLTRFDFLLSAAALPLVIILRNKSLSIKENSLYLMGFLITLSPWILYSLTTFQRLWVTDNSRTALLAFTNYVSDYFPRDAVLPTLFNHPKQWLYLYFTERLPAQFDTLGSFSLLRPLIPLAVFVLLKRAPLKDGKRLFARWGQLGLLWLVLIFAVSLTGYSAKRYYTVVYWYVGVLVLILAGVRLKESRWRIVILLAMLGIAVFYNTEQFIMDSKQKIAIGFNRENISAESYRSLIEKVPVGSSILFWGAGEEFKFGALTGRKTLFMPPNIEDNPRLIEQFLADYPADYVLIRASAMNKAELLRQKVTFIIENDDGTLDILHP